MYYWYICFFCQFHVVYSLTVLVVIITKPRKNTRFMKNLPFELEIKNLTEVKSDSRLSKSPLKATSFQLIWLSEGEAIFDIDFKQIKIKAGEIEGKITADGTDRVEIEGSKVGELSAISLGSLFLSVTENNLVLIFVVYEYQTIFHRLVLFYIF